MNKTEFEIGYFEALNIKELHHRQALIKEKTNNNGREGQYWAPAGPGYTQFRDNAGVQTIISLLNWLGRNYDERIILEVLEEDYEESVYPPEKINEIWKGRDLACPNCHGNTRLVLEREKYLLPGVFCPGCGFWKKLPGTRQIKAENALTPAVLDLIRDTPENPQARAHVYAAMHKPIPEDLRTWPEIKDWIEYDGGPFPNESWGGDRVTVPEESNSDAFTIGVHGNRTEYGRCNYREQQFASGPLLIQKRHMDELLGEADDFDDCVSKVMEWLLELFQSGELNFAPVPGAEVHYEDHEQDEDGPDYGPMRVDGNLAEAVKRYVIANFPDTAADWDLGE